jgi:diketogulonate reductase-like aldo/keto reductase
MDKRSTGANWRDVPVVGQGTWYIERAERKAAIAALQRGLDLGMMHIDTAELYGAGVAEEIVAEAIAGRRDSVHLVSKVMPQNASRAGTISACEDSLRRLKTDRLDCYLLHWRSRSPLSETIAAFETLKADGKIRAWGVSNFDADDLEETLAVAGDGAIACNQVLYHLNERGIEHDVIPWCEANKVAVVGYSPFGHDSFPAADSAGGRVLLEIAAKRKSTARQVALAFLTRRPSLYTIPKASKIPHVIENAGAGFALDATEISRIDQAFPVGRRRGLAML